MDCLAANPAHEAISRMMRSARSRCETRDDWRDVARKNYTASECPECTPANRDGARSFALCEWHQWRHCTAIRGSEAPDARRSCCRVTLKQRLQTSVCQAVRCAARPFTHFRKSPRNASRSGLARRRARGPQETPARSNGFGSVRTSPSRMRTCAAGNTPAGD